MGIVETVFIMLFGVWWCCVDHGPHDINERAFDALQRSLNTPPDAKSPASISTCARPLISDKWLGIGAAIIVCSVAAFFALMVVLSILNPV